MNSIAMMLPAMQTASAKTVKNQAAPLNGEKQAYSDFSNLLNQEKAQQFLSTAPIVKKSSSELINSGLINKLLKLELKDFEALLASLVEADDLSAEDLTLLQEMEKTLQVLQQNAAESPEEVSDSSIIEDVVYMASDTLLGKMIHQYQITHNDYIVRAQPIGEVRIIERINEDGTLVLRPTDPVADEKKVKLQPIDPFIEFNTIQQEAKQVLSQVENILSNIRSLTDIPQVAPKVLELLQQWQKLVVQSGSDAEKLTNLNLENKQFSSVWKQLVQTYQNRVGIQSQNSYNLDAKVTTNDVVRWLGNAMEAIVQTEKPVQAAPITSPTMPISRVEQFVIHLNQPQQTQTQTKPVDKQLVEQFQRIIDTNRIMNLQNGRGQLAITLKPHHLGEMLVRFTQVNGEMMVKILVTTESAKKMLEGNMQQLRSMFSPHQVVIDRQEGILTENQESQKGQERNDQQGTRDEAHNEQEQHQADSDSFSTIFEELIVNEEV